MSSRRLIVALLAFSLACTRGSDPPREVATNIAAAPAKSAAPAMTESAKAPDTVADAASTEAKPRARSVVSARSIGNTSVVFKLTFDSSEKAAYKPRSKRGRDRYKGEVAAYRLAQALGIANVPPVTFERLKVSELATALGGHPPGLELAKRELVADADGFVPGALIPWITDLEFIKLEAEPWRSKWRGWLLGRAPVPEADRAIAAQIATMIIFDSLTGNWDRWSGANVGFDKARQQLIFVDNDGAFMVPTPAVFDRQRDLMKQLVKAPRGLTAKLRAADEAFMKKSVGEETPGTPLLSDAALRGLEARRKTVLEELDARIREIGEASVLAFD